MRFESLDRIRTKRLTVSFKAMQDIACLAHFPESFAREASVLLNGCKGL